MSVLVLNAVGQSFMDPPAGKSDFLAGEGACKEEGVLRSCNSRFSRRGDGGKIRSRVPVRPEDRDHIRNAHPRADGGRADPARRQRVYHRRRNVRTAKLLSRRGERVHRRENAHGHAAEILSCRDPACFAGDPCDAGMPSGGWCLWRSGGSASRCDGEFPGRGRFFRSPGRRKSGAYAPSPDFSDSPP